LSGGTVYLLRNTGTEGGDNGLFLGQGATNNSTANISGGALYGIEIGMGGAGAQSSQFLNISAGTIYLGFRGVNTFGGANSGTQTVTIGGGVFHTLDMVTITTVANSGSAATLLADGTNWTWTANLPVNLTNSSFSVNGVAGTGKVTFDPEAKRTITLNNQWFGVGNLVINGPGTVAIGGADSYTGGTTINAGGNIAFNNGGSVADPVLTIPATSSLILNTTGTATFTNIVVGAGNVAVANSGVVNVGSNLQNTGAIIQSNGVLVVNGSILNASLLTNSSPATTGPLVAQGTIMTPIGIGTNSSIEMGTTIQAGTLMASNVVLNGTWIEKLNTPLTVGGGVNDLLICSNLTLNPSSVLAITPWTAPSAGSYVIAEYSGTLNGPGGPGTGQFGTFTNATGDTMSVDYSTPHEIILNVTSLNQANLVWSATNFSPNINWDVNTSANWTNTATSALSTFHQQDTVALNAVPGTGITNRVAVTGQILPAQINISGGLPYLISGTGYISGGTGINYSDTNVSGIYTSGNNYTGAVTITSGVLQLGSGGSSWLGTTNGATAVNGGTLDLNGQGIGAEPLVIQGTGSPFAGTNNGAINNSASTSPGQAAGPLNVTLAGDATLNASGSRWDIGPTVLGAGGGSFAGNSHNLTKIGNQPIWMHEVGDIGVDNIDIQQGLLGFEFTIGMGDPAGSVTVEPGAILGFYQLSSNSILNKTMVLNNNATLQSGGAAGTSNNFAGPITLNGTNSIQTSIFPLNLTGPITGSGGFSLSGTGPLYLGGNDTYSGPTLMAGNSQLALEGAGSIPNTPLIYMTPAASTMVDASGAGSMTLNSGQTLEGSGYVAGNFTANSGSSIIIGTNALTYGTMIFTNNLTLNGGSISMKLSDPNNVGLDNDIILVNGNLALSASSTFTVTPLLGLISGVPYTLAEVNGSVPGSAANVHIVCPNPRYTFTPSFGTDFNSKEALLVSVGGNAGPLEWQGYVTPNWDMGTLNWLNTGSSAHDQFYPGDTATFDDNSTVTSVTVNNNLLISAGMNMENVANTYTFTGGGVIYGPLNMEGNGSGTGGSTILAMSNAPAFTSIDSSAGTLVFDLQGITNYTVGALLTDSNGLRAGTIIFGGTNTATLTANNVPIPDLLGSYNPDFDGTIMVTNGILQYTNVDSLGVDTSVNSDPAFSPIIITNNGSLNFNGVPAGPSAFASFGGAKWIHISGSGYNGQGALMDSAGNGEPNGAFCYLYFDGDATIGIASSRCDQHVLSGNTQQIEGNGHNLTFIGGGAFFIYPQSDGDTHLGDIDVASTNGGRLAFQSGPDALGDVNGYLTVEPAGEVTFFNFSNNLDSVHFGIQKNVWLKGNAAIDSGGNGGTESNNFDGPIFLTGTNLIGLRYDMHVWNNIMDSNSPGSLILGNDSVGASGANAALWLDGANNSYSGATIISNATIRVGASSTLGQSSFVQVNTNATLNLSATPAYTFGAGLTMVGNGTVVGPATGSVNFNTGSTLVIGLPTATGLLNPNITTFAISNNVVFAAGSTIDLVANKSSAAAGAVPADKLFGAKSLTLNGTLVVTNLGSKPFVAGDTLALFNATAISTNGSYNIVPATPGPGLVWNIAGIPGSGTLAVVSQFPSFTSPPPISFSSANNQFMLRWPSNYVGYYYLQVQTNPLTVGLSTDWVPYNGSASATLTSPGITNSIDPNAPTVFYRLMTNAP
jgi:autotransporter-associated beta strand protein